MSQDLMPDHPGRHSPSLFQVILGGTVAAAVIFVAVVQTQPVRSLRHRQAQWHHTLAPGDLLFQDLDCGLRCDLIRVLTRSPYTHVGLVLAGPAGDPEVWEAFDPVGPKPLLDFVERGRDRLLAVYRLEPALIERLPEIRQAAEAMRGRPYDGDYQWDDEAIYCSELIEKAVFRATGIELSPPRPLGSGAFGEYAATIKKVTKGRLTEQTLITSPLDLTRSPHLGLIVDELQGTLITDGGRP